MKKLTLAFALLSTAALAGSAFADDNRGDHRDDGRAPIVDGRGSMIDHRMDARPSQPPRWELVTTARASGRRGLLTFALAPMTSYDQLRLVGSERLDIVAVELSYGRGRTVLVQPQADGLVNLDLGRGSPRSIVVRYVNRGRGRGFDATIQMLGKAQAPIVVGQRDHGSSTQDGEHGWRGYDGSGRGAR